MSALAIAVPQRKSVATVTVALPMPPSTNNLWTCAGRGRLTLTKAYRDWKSEAGWLLCQQRPGRVDGSYALRLQACRDSRCDLDNLCKAASDLLQTHGVIENDKLAEKITLEWGAPEGILVSVISTRERQAA